ncbi:Snf2 family protein [Capsulimonas corticalis]|uniref:Snf2 family protein n=1 Tax=Capsulimonas corticalis TaxID=2219043 RepID=A0A9N7LAI5_9BACT|nr:DEAD/DEAH box helicase [Capsulimonas corticalis]BDI34452.1 Snf2 family protein [Capsulimonas corticalis]
MAIEWLPAQLTPATQSQTKSSEILNLESLSPGRLAGSPDPESYRKGIAYYNNGQVQLSHLDSNEAVLYVDGSLPEPYEVCVWVDGGKTYFDCECPVARDFTKTICKHKVAAALFLAQHFETEKAGKWEMALSDVLTPKQTKKTRTTQSLLFFSLQSRRMEWSIAAYSIPASNFTSINIHDHAAVAAQVKTLGLSKKATAIKNISATAKYLNATSSSILVAQLLGMNEQYTYYYYYNAKPLALDKIFPLLADCIVFRGTEQDPLQKPLKILTEPAAAELELHAAAEGMEIQPVITRNDRPEAFNLKKHVIVHQEPMWLLEGDALYPVTGTSDALVGLMSATREKPIFIPNAEKDRFFDAYLPQLTEQVQVRGEMVSWETHDSPPAPRIYLNEEDQQMRAQLRFGYGEHEITAGEPGAIVTRRKPGEAAMVRIHRHPELEEAHWQQMSKHGLKRGPSTDIFLLRAKTEPVDFLLHHVPKLAEAGFDVYGEEHLTSARINRNRPTMNFSVSSGIDWFDVKAVAQFGDQEVPLSVIRQAMKRREKYIKLADGSIGAIPEDWLERYKHLFAFAETTEDGLRIGNDHIALIDQLLEEDEAAVQIDVEFNARRDRLRAFSEIKPHALPKGFEGELRPYQKHGYDWLHFLHDYELGGCLADDMGIGKTVQALTFLQSLGESGHAEAASLIVLPRSLLFNWEREAAKFTPGLRVLMHSENSRTKNTHDFDEYDIILTTYGVMMRDIEFLRKYKFHYVVLDEAQAIKNPASQTAKSARLLKADHKLTLTGTPVENSTVELWSQFAFLNPGLLGSFEYFRDQFANAIERKQDERSADLLRKMVFPFILRRTKDQVATELPPRTERILTAEMEPAQRKLYNETRDKFRDELLQLIDTGGMNSARMRVLEALLRLRQIANHPRLIEGDSPIDSAKFELLIETLETLRSEGHKALIFSQFVKMLTLVREALEERDIPYMYLDGKTKDRQSRVDTFQADDQIPFFLISLKAGGTGLNLTAADYVIHIDPWWNPAVERQATDRTHRIGQTKPVFVYKLITRDTVEEKILELQDRKRALAEQLIATEGGFFKSLTKEDVGSLLG